MGCRSSAPVRPTVVQTRPNIDFQLLQSVSLERPQSRSHANRNSDIIPEFAVIPLQKYEESWIDPKSDKTTNEHILSVRFTDRRNPNAPRFTVKQEVLGKIQECESALESSAKGEEDNSKSRLVSSNPVRASVFKPTQEHPPESSVSSVDEEQSPKPFPNQSSRHAGHISRQLSIVPTATLHTMGVRSHRTLPKTSTGVLPSRDELTRVTTQRRSLTVERGEASTTLFPHTSAESII